MVDCETRLKRRNPDDGRIGGLIYSEMHHILPKHSGGDNSKENLVRLLPEEHYIAHMLLWKAYKNPKDFYAVRCIVNGFLNKKSLKLKIPENEYNSLKTRIGLYKQYIYNFRIHNGWQTDDGIRRISESRKGTMPCVDSNTGIKVGVFPTNHPDVISGKYVHHSKGKLSVIRKSDGVREFIKRADFNEAEYIKNYRDMSGRNNPNYKSLTDEFLNLLYSKVILSVENGHFNVRAFIDCVNADIETIGIRKISKPFILSRFGSIPSFLEEYNKIFGTKFVYNGLYRGFSTYKNQPKFGWVTNEIVDLKVKLNEIDDFLSSNSNYRRGRLKKKGI